MFKRWCNSGEAFDNECRKYEEQLKKAKKGDYDHWAQEPYGRMALIILLDQLSRNMYRKKAKAFEGDEKAVKLTQEGLKKAGSGCTAIWIEVFSFCLSCTQRLRNFRKNLCRCSKKTWNWLIWCIRDLCMGRGRFRLPKHIGILFRGLVGILTGMRF